MSFKKTAAVIVFFLSITLVIILLFRYFNSFQKLTIHFSVKNISATIYEAKVGDGSLPLDYYKDRKIETLKNNEIITLKKGEYVVVVAANGDYKEFKQAVNLGDEEKTLTINPNYTEKKLTQLLEESVVEIHQTLQKKYPRIDLYDIEKGKLYNQGEWYGTKLVYKDQTDGFVSDSLRVILKKQSNKSWKVVTDPPQIMISGVLFPQIPHDIVSDVDRM